MQYSLEQGLISRKMTMDELFIDSLSREVDGHWS